jgi:ABC-2 type transport system ATP-binding protein
MYGMPDPKGAALVALEEVGLAARADDRVGAYSGGMQRRLNLAAALVHAPTVLLLDEPTAGVDPQSRARIRDIVRQRARDGAAVLLTTHDMEEAEKVCDRISVMDHGRVLADGSVKELLSMHAPADGNARGLEGVFLHLTGRSLRE